MSTPHALSCFTSTASPATLPACTSSLAALPSLAALFFSCSTSFTCSTSSLATRRPCTSCPPSCTAHVTRRPARPTGRLATAALAAHRPALAALARHLLFFFHGTCSQHERTAALAAWLQHGAARHNPAVRMRLPLRPAPDAPRPLHLRHRGLVSAAVLHAERWRGRAGGRRYLHACTKCER